MARGHESLDERLLHRQLFFTDAVFAIVMTILVLELRPPEGPVITADEVVRVANELIAFVMSFAICSIFWLAHMNSTRRLAHFDWPVALLNLVFLLPVCLVPFVTAWGFKDPLSWGAYCLVMMSISAANVALTIMASRDDGRLEATGKPRDRASRIARGASPGLAFGVGLLLVLAGLPKLAYACPALIPLFIWASVRIFRPTPEAAVA